MNKIDFARAFRWFDAICALDYYGVVVDALKALNPIQTRRQAPPTVEPQVQYQTEAQARDAARKRAQRRQEAAETLADVRAQRPGVQLPRRQLLDRCHLPKCWQSCRAPPARVGLERHVGQQRSGAVNTRTGWTPRSCLWHDHAQFATELVHTAA